MTSLILITMDSGRGHCAWWQSCKVPKPIPQRNKNREMYAIKQINICAEYCDMLPRPGLDLSGTLGLRPIGLSTGSWQTSLGLGSMSRYSAQFLICLPIMSSFSRRNKNGVSHATLSSEGFNNHIYSSQRDALFINYLLHWIHLSTRQFFYCYTYDTSVSIFNTRYHDQGRDVFCTFLTIWILSCIMRIILNRLILRIGMIKPGNMIFFLDILHTQYCSRKQD